MLVSGLPGSGKTTVATYLAATYGWVHLSSDLTRKDFGGPASDEHLDAGFRRGLHSLERTALTHSILNSQARTALAREISVVLPTFDEAGTAAQSTGYRLDQDAPASCSPVSGPAPRRPATSSGTATTGHEACAGTCVRICRACGCCHQVAQHQ